MSRRPLAIVIVSIGLSAALWSWTTHVRASSAAAPAATFEVYKDKSGGYRWRLRALNTAVLATSGEGFKQKQSCLDSIESVKKAAADAPVKELSDEPAEEGK